MRRRSKAVAALSSFQALTTRNASTTVELRDGQSFAVAGLLSSQNRSNVAQVPWLGSVPVLGALFRSAAYQQKETDLVIIVTPRLIAPVVPGQRLVTPLDSRLPANDVDFFLMGQPEVKKEYSDYVGRGGEAQGAVRSHDPARTGHAEARTSDRGRP